ncbi:MULTISPECIES: hypothetical protein [unclassified Streptomyces]|uniref:hypothetical protein n=1 Tax=unclassified Streptomyces TaxID=2593676 RepID=UPI000AB8E267|nr:MULTISPECIES: hypothetical protein [unclassified Streptomyces]WOX10733.1 hypothetical protein R2B38_18645 [Streptomyces sp. N50]
MRRKTVGLIGIVAAVLVLGWGTATELPANNGGPDATVAAPLNNGGPDFISG